MIMTAIKGSNQFIFKLQSTSNLQQDIINGCLQFQAEGIAGILTIQHILVIDVEQGNGRYCWARESWLLVLLSLSGNLLLQGIKLSPKRFQD